MTDTFQHRFIQGMNIRGLRQVDVAERTGLDKAQISQYKNGKYEPMQDALYKLAKALNVNVAWLMGHDVPMDVDVVELEKNCSIYERLSKYQELIKFTPLIDAYNKLNDDGKKKALEYIQDLSDLKKYSK